MKKHYVVILILVIIAAGAVFAFAYGKNKEADILNQSATISVPAIDSNPITIDYTDKGFSPNVLTIRAGQKIVFKNDSSEYLWIASGPHPMDDAYPEFNANRTYPPGQDYIFTFARTGTWEFHNHLNESDIGTTIVNP